MKQLLIATHNQGKLAEYKLLLKNFPISLASLKDVGIAEHAEEHGETLEENARIKAEFYAARTNLALLAEDTGLEIDALHGNPGNRTRRWPGYEASDEELIAYGLKKMERVPDEKRGAQFRVVLALKLPNKELVMAEGVLRGVIAKQAISKIIPGLPFRSIFYIPSVGKMLGELSSEEEARFSHRKSAIEKITPALKAWLASA